MPIYIQIHASFDSKQNRDVCKVEKRMRIVVKNYLSDSWHESGEEGALQEWVQLGIWKLTIKIDWHDGDK